MGGHIVQGHVDGVGSVRDVRADGFARIVTIDAPGPSVLRYVVEKGSVAVDGVSLTVARVDDESFDVSLIPETLERTTLGRRRARRAGQPGGRHRGQVRGEARGSARLVSDTTTTPFATVEEALEDIAAGRMVVVVDDEDRENEGDLVMAAEFVDADAINFMTRQAGGWICLALTPERCDELGLELMAAKNESAYETPFTVTIEAREGVTTGISTSDQAQTMRVAIDPAKGPGDIVVPGHVHPLKARGGGVLERTGHTEASVDLARLAGVTPAGVICEIQNEDGSMARARRPRRLLPQARPEDDHDRRSDRLPPPPRQARRARRVDQAAHGLRRVRRRRLPLARRREAPRRARQGRRSPAPRTCSCACTPSA